MGSVSTEDRTGHIYLQQDISGEFTKVLAGSNHDSVNTFLEHLFDLYTKASKTTQAVVVREDVAQKFTALQCETRFQTSDDLMKHLLHLHVDYLKNSNNDIAKQTPREKTNPRKSRKSQPKRNIKHVTESDESCDLVKTNGNDDPWSDRSAASSRESTAECTDRMVDLSRVKEEITDTDKVIKSEQADKVSLIKRIFHKRDGSETSCTSSATKTNHSSITRSKARRSLKRSRVTKSNKLKSTRVPVIRVQRLPTSLINYKLTADVREANFSAGNIEIDVDDMGFDANPELDEETRLACVNIENVEGEKNNAGLEQPDLNHSQLSFDYGDHSAKQTNANKTNMSESKSAQKTKYTYDCFKCKKKFKTRAPLNLHISMEHKDDAPVCILCSLCGKQVDYDHELTLHEKFICKKIERNFECPKCLLSFADQAEIESHPCSNNIAKPYYCSVQNCGTYFKNVRDLTEHVTRHLGIKPFLCNICGKAFSAKKDLDRHADTHKETKDYKCEDCGSSFRSYHTLRRHISSHVFKDRYKCTKCSYTTPLKNTFKQHMIKHSNYTNQCTVCMKKLRSKRSLEKHVQNRHTFNRIFTCRFCDFSTSVGLSYSCHMRKHKNAKNKSDDIASEPRSPEADLSLPHTETEKCSVQPNTSNDVNSLQLVATKLVTSATPELTLTSVCSTNVPMLAEVAYLENMEVGITGKNSDAIMANIVAASDASDIAVITSESSHPNLIMYHMDTPSTSLNIPNFVTDAIHTVSDRESWENTSEHS